MEHPKPTASTVYKLYGSSRHCAFPDCREPHIEVDENTGVKICNAEVSHIHARRENGPRWDASQSSEDNRSDGNLMLLCRKHHAVVDDRRNEKYYTPDLLKAWKAEQEMQEGDALAAEDLEAIEQTNVIIAADTVNLGGEGGSAPGAGGGGGAGLGSNARGGDGGDGGRCINDGRLIDASAMKSWTVFVREGSDERLPGSGGGGSPGIGDNSVGGRGGNGGDYFVCTAQVTHDQYRVKVGRGARLPGEIGGSSYIEGINADGSTERITPIAYGGLSGYSHLPDDVPEIDAKAIERGVRVCCLTVVEGATIENGAHAIRRFALSGYDVRELPVEIVFNVLTAVTKQPDERTGYFVSLFFDGEEKARIAVRALEREDGFLSTSFCFPIGAYFETEGLCRIIAHASGISLCETAIEIRRR
ncbi:hypothetical protein [Cognatiyoonia sp. IB215182]|uniref:hypothetical protein n=1 Tax=Cognatiyoonia sp. IB215182 TaxID=3097353 RepID=UPI002A0FDF07|nr:hypothetical protein [Cognatiyoonia sp. IB215182]MDX8355187.1 hypothetical protein [Cognatiyoonia sp. IB215182]